ncbi:hypothetical protein B0H65DRAFT_464237 [Neurospora tetraspora]|uniref:Uncharacterized protein n=1 Tax=Neurospora tetraspora TaxID=94610 RepID=A0AAE0MR80_9PEZI|nr:hypothetical protein B0H65DRAFT_464237 [Neurospora tetraspora]
MGNIAAFILHVALKAALSIDCFMAVRRLTSYITDLFTLSTLPIQGRMIMSIVELLANAGVNIDVVKPPCCKPPSQLNQLSIRFHLQDHHEINERMFGLPFVGLPFTKPTVNCLPSKSWRVWDELSHSCIYLHSPRSSPPLPLPLFRSSGPLTFRYSRHGSSICGERLSN